jgi:hypothetical protein
VKDGVALVFERNCDDKSRLFIALSEVLHKSPLFETNILRPSERVGCSVLVATLEN